MTKMTKALGQYPGKTWNAPRNGHMPALHSDDPLSGRNGRTLLSWTDKNVGQLARYLTAVLAQAYQFAQGDLYEIQRDSIRTTQDLVARLLSTRPDLRSNYNPGSHQKRVLDEAVMEAFQKYKQPMYAAR